MCTNAPTSSFLSVRLLQRRCHYVAGLRLSSSKLMCFNETHACTTCPLLLFRTIGTQCIILCEIQKE
jgi:hypothetical protein